MKELLKVACVLLLVALGVGAWSVAQVRKMEREGPVTLYRPDTFQYNLPATASKGDLIVGFFDDSCSVNYTSVTGTTRGIK
jgi:hypothetical protein